MARKKKPVVQIRWSNRRVKCPAEKAYGFFEHIRERNGGSLDLDDAVEQSRPEDAPLHNDLEWDDAICGMEYRRDQMRRIVRTLEVVRSDTTTPTRAYEAIPVEVMPITPNADDGEQSRRSYVFRRTEDILADPAGRAELLGQAIRDALAFRKRYAALSELANVIGAIDDTLRNIS